MMKDHEDEMTTTMHEREPILSESRVKKSSRYTKSYKYKHKASQQQELAFGTFQLKIPSLPYYDYSCDHHSTNFAHKRKRRRRRSKEKCNNSQEQSPVKKRAGLAILISQVLAWSQPLLLLLLCHLLAAVPTVNAFCPSKCLCDDTSLSANCTRVPSISVIPMTLNPLLKRLTLNQLPMVELSNSLSVYRQLEYLNLNSNQLRSVSYENFNFKPAPASIVLISSYPPIPAAPSSFSQEILSIQRELHQELGANNEQLARHLRLTLDKTSLADSIAAGEPQLGEEQSNKQEESAAEPKSSSSEEEIGFHLRELDLGDNRIELLGGVSEQQVAADSLDSSSSQVSSQAQSGHSRRLKSSDLERLAPFLTLTKLEQLNLAGNRLVRLHQHVFLGLLNLRSLDLSRNWLEFIDKHAFVGLLELRSLRLSKNRLARHLHHLGVAFCRAPMNELRSLELSDNHQQAYHSQPVPSRNLHQLPATQRAAQRSQQQQDAAAEVYLLPNQMFICTPRLVSLALEGLQLRYIQVNAFDNLQSLEQLHLGRNQLEQVPKDSLTFSHSNLSETLRDLDLSENPIEFVNANSFEALPNLQRLSLNSMPRLVSFDLASFSVRRSHFLGLERHHRLAGQNDKLQELSLKQNPQLQALHSSISARLSFTRLSLLNLAGASELREFPLDEMIDFSSLQDNQQLQLDLSFVSKLNCSACQLGWLLNAAAQQLLASRYHPTPSFLWETNTNFPSNLPHGPAAGQQARKISLGSSLETIGCSWPFAMPLVQLVQLAAPFRPDFRHCAGTESAPLGAPGPTRPQLALQPEASNSSREQSGPQDELLLRSREQLAQLGWPVGAGLLALLLLVCAGSLKLALGLLQSRRAQDISAARPSGGFKWLQSGRATRTGCPLSSPAQSSSSAAAGDCSSSSILSTATTRLAPHKAPDNHHHLLLQQQQQHYSHLASQYHCAQEPDCPLAGSLATTKSRSRLRRLMNFKDPSGPVVVAVAGRENWRANLFSRIVGRLRVSAATSRLAKSANFLPGGDSSSAAAAAAHVDRMLFADARWEGGAFLAKEKSENCYYFSPNAPQLLCGQQPDRQFELLVASERRELRAPELELNLARKQTLSSLSSTCQQHSQGQFAAKLDGWSGQLSQQQQVRLSQDVQPARAGSSSSRGSQVVIDGHIYVTLDGPIKQGAGEASDEWSKQQQVVYEPPRPPQLHATPLPLGDANSSKSKGKSVAVGRREANCPATLDYKSFEWSPSSSTGSSSSSQASNKRPEKLAKCDEDEKFKIANPGEENKMVYSEGRCEPVQESYYSDSSEQLERQLAKQLGKLSFQSEGKNRQQDAQSPRGETNNNNNNNNTAHNSNANANASANNSSAVGRSEIHLRDNMVACTRLLASEGSKNNEGPSIAAAAAFESSSEVLSECNARRGGGKNKMEKSAEKNWLHSHRSATFGKQNGAREPDLDVRKQLLAGRRALCSELADKGGNVTGHTDCGQRTAGQQCKLTQEDGRDQDEEAARQLFMSPNGRHRSAGKEVAGRGRVSKCQPPSGWSRSGPQAQPADANHGLSSQQQQQLAAQLNCAPPSSTRLQINNHSDYVINGLQQQDRADGSHRHLAGAEPEVGVAQQPSSGQNDRRRLKENPFPFPAQRELIMIGQRNFPPQSGENCALDKQPASGPEFGSQPVARSTFNGVSCMGKLESSLDGRTIELRESCDYSQDFARSQRNFCDISELAEATQTEQQSQHQHQHQQQLQTASKSKLISDSASTTDQQAHCSATNEIYSNQFYYYSPPSKQLSTRQQNDHPR